MRLLIIGGSDAGISAALRAHELSPDTEVTLILADDFPNFSICGLPYFLGGETPDWRDLAHRTEFPGIDICRRHVARSIDPSSRRVNVDIGGLSKSLAYDRLIVATGAHPIRPQIPGAAQAGVFLLHSMDDSFAIDRYVSSHDARKAVIVGGGYIGLEMSDALTKRGLEVTLLSRADTVLPTSDPEFGHLVQQELIRNGVHVLTGCEAARIEEHGSDVGLIVADTFGGKHKADIVILATGVRPNAEIALTAGARPGAGGAIAVNRRMETGLPDIYAAGDCVETAHRLLPEPTYISLGTIAHKQGRVAGENAVGGDREFPGTLGSQSLKVFDLIIARTGLLQREAVQAGYDSLTTQTTANDHKVYYPGAVPLHIRLTGDRTTGRLLGGQILGGFGAEISKRIDILASVIHHGGSVEAVNDLDLTYTPPLSSPWDPVQIAAQEWSAHRRSLFA